MNVLPQASLFLGIIPALILLYLSLKGYEGYYKDKTIFFTFVIGIVIGFFATLARVVSPPAASLSVIAVYALLFATFEQLFKTMILNLRRFQNRRETIIYGLSLGLGFGAVFTPFLITAIGPSIMNDLNIFALVVLGSFGFILVHGATGAYIGYGVYASKPIKYLIIAVIIQLPFNGIIELTRLFFSTNYFAYLQLGLVVYGLGVFGYTLKKIMPKILSTGQRRKRTKKITKERT